MNRLKQMIAPLILGTFTAATAFAHQSLWDEMTDMQ
jgi:hypothetical protein